MYVETEEGLERCIEILEKSSSIGVSVESHSERSYFGITCVISISNGYFDFVIDALQLY